MNSNSITIHVVTSFMSWLLMFQSFLAFIHYIFWLSCMAFYLQQSLDFELHSPRNDDGSDDDAAEKKRDKR